MVLIQHSLSSSLILIIAGSPTVTRPPYVVEVDRLIGYCSTVSNATASFLIKKLPTERLGAADRSAGRVTESDTVKPDDSTVEG